MKITAISDQHGYYPRLTGGDLLIVAGDCTAKDQELEWDEFFTWLVAQKYEKKVLIPGNHDGMLTQKNKYIDWNVDVLIDEGTEYQGLKIWGSPWTKLFLGINPECAHFTFPEHPVNVEKMHWKKIPFETDILITHMPPYEILDRVGTKKKGISCGSVDLRRRVYEIQPKLHVFGHLHAQGGQISRNPKDFPSTTFANCAVTDEHYYMRKKIIQIEL